jgi:hypothetical protein
MISTHISNVAINQSPLNSLQLKVKLVIHNQCPGIELVSPVCAGEGIICHLSPPDQRVNVGSTTQADFNMYFLGKAH